MRYTQIYLDIVFELFPNVNKITIYTTDEMGKYEYRIHESSLMELVDYIDGKDVEVEVIAWHRYQIVENNTKKYEYIGDSWIDREWCKKQRITRRRFEGKKCRATLKSINASIETNDGIRHRLEQSVLRIHK